MLGGWWLILRIAVILAAVQFAWRWLGVGSGAALVLNFVRSLDPKASGADLGLLIVFCFAACAAVGLLYFIIGNAVAMYVAQARKRRGL